MRKSTIVISLTVLLLCVLALCTVQVSLFVTVDNGLTTLKMAKGIPGESYIVGLGLVNKLPIRISICAFEAEMQQYAQEGLLPSRKIRVPVFVDLESESIPPEWKVGVTLTGPLSEVKLKRELASAIGVTVGGHRQVMIYPAFGPDPTLTQIRYTNFRVLIGVGPIRHWVRVTTPEEYTLCYEPDSCFSP